MFDIGGPELIVIAIFILIFAGPKHLPELMRKAGRIAAELRSASRELRTQIESETADLESPREIGRQIRKEITDELMEPYSDIVSTDRMIRSKAVELSREVTRDLDVKESDVPQVTTGNGDDP